MSDENDPIALAAASLRAAVRKPFPGSPAELAKQYNAAMSQLMQGGAPVAVLSEESHGKLSEFMGYSSLDRAHNSMMARVAGPHAKLFAESIHTYVEQGIRERARIAGYQ